MSKANKITGLTVKNFTVFEEQTFAFSPGINVVIGQNGTGKSSLLKLLYASAYSNWRILLTKRFEQPGRTDFEKLVALFAPEKPEIRSLFRKRSAEMSLEFCYNGVTSPSYMLRSGDYGTISSGMVPTEEEPLFIPSSDVLAQYPGLMFRFARGYETRDETYRDIAEALSGTEKSGLGDHMADVVRSIEGIIGGPVVLEKENFYIGKGRDRLIANLAAEGHRKLATLAHLINNGSLRSGSILFWDEPEANLNPKLISQTVEIIRALAAADIQVFVATHDFLVTNEFGLAAEYNTSPKVPIKFIALDKKSKKAPTTHTESEQLAGVEPNAILEEFAAHYHREAEIFKKFARGEDV